MFNINNDVSVSALQGRVFVYQTSVVMLASPSSQADPLARLEKGTAIDIVSLPEQAPEGWLAVRTMQRKDGFIRTTTGLITQEQLLVEREKIQSGYKIGRAKIVMGACIFLFGIITCVAPFIISPNHGGVSVLYYGAVLAGAGEFFWGWEQVTNVRRALKEFDAFWQGKIG